jgi:hypothetical protein
MPQGRMDEAMAEIENVLQTDPLSLFMRWWLAVVAYLGRLPDRVIAEARHTIALDPTHFLGYWTVGIGLDRTGAGREAVGALERAHELSGGMPFTLGFLAYVCGRAGKCDDARRLLESAERLATAGYVPRTTFALGHIDLADWDAAFEWMDKAIEIHDPIIMLIKSYLFLNPVHGDAWYRALLQKMHLED